MVQFLIRRILLFIPTLIIISLIAFIISMNAPGDPVFSIMYSAELSPEFQSQSSVQMQQQKFLTHRLGLDLPVFYFSITPASFPDTLYKFYDRGERSGLQSLLYQFGNWKLIDSYHSSLKILAADLDQLATNSSSSKKISTNEADSIISQSQFNSILLLNASQPDFIALKLAELQKQFSAYPFFNLMQADLNDVKQKLNALKASSPPLNFYLPAIHFYPYNQYARWLFGDGINSTGLIHGDLGISFVSQAPVNTIILQHIGWSLLLTFISVILAYVISLPVGIRSAVKHDSAFDHTASITLILLHSLPSFFVATLLLFTFANTDVLHWFPASGVKPAAGYPIDASLPEKIKLSLPYFILPSIAYTYSSLAFLSRLTRGSMLEIMQQDYVRTARAKGLSEHAVIYKHALRNALLPIITVFANIFPMVLGGSVILEFIFTIPGMGLETYQAILNQDYPMIIGVFTLTGVLTLTGYLVADVLYALADPRISFSKK